MYLLDFCLGLVGLVAVGLHCGVGSVVGLAYCGFCLVGGLGIYVCCFAWCLMLVWRVCLWCEFVRLVLWLGLVLLWVFVNGWG